MWLQKKRKKDPFNSYFRKLTFMVLESETELFLGHLIKYFYPFFGFSF